MDFDTKGQEVWVGNADVEREGVWFPLSSEENSPSFKIAFAHRSNPEYQSAFEKAMRPYRKQFAVDPGASAKFGDKIMREVFASAILKDWKNINQRIDIRDDEGKVIRTEIKPVTPTYEHKLAYLETRPRIFDKLVEVAKEAEYFSDASLVDEEADKGNSRASSVGN